MDRLAQTIAGVEFKNPIIVSSGPLTRKLNLIKRAEDNGAAAVSTKHSLMEQPFRGKSRWYHEHEVGIVTCSEPRLDLEQGEDLIRRVREETDLIVLANMSGPPARIEGWGETAKRLEAAGAHFIEVNMNCPNLGISKQMDSEQEVQIPLGGMIGQDPVLASSITRHVKQSVNIPVISKLISEGGRIVEVSKACETAGADVLNIHAGGPGAPGLDIYNGGRPKVAGLLERASFGGTTGPWSRLVSNRFVADVRRATATPLIGGGGIFQWEHIVESIMYGASVIQVCTSLMLKGFKLISTWLEALQSFLEETGHRDLTSISGIALKYICAPKELVIIPVVARVDREKCVGCGQCIDIGHCDAIELRDEKANVAEDLCIGCATCVALCPTSAFFMETGG